jgi:hypothetical protein
MLTKEKNKEKINLLKILVRKQGDITGDFFAY